MKNTIFGNRINKTINVVINGKPYSMSAVSEEEAKQIYGSILKAMNDPSESNIAQVQSYFSLGNKGVVHRELIEGGFEFDPSTAEYYLEGFNTPVPVQLIETVKEYVENDYPLDSIKNFWTLLMANPDKRVRQDLFKFTQTYNLSITNMGYIVTYKRVGVKTNKPNELDQFVEDSYSTVKRQKRAPKKYVVYQKFDTQDTFMGYGFTEFERFAKWTVENNLTNHEGYSVNQVGNLQDLYDEIKDEPAQEDLVFTDLHTGQMMIKVGEPVKMERKDCDGDPKEDCSYGLHVGAPSYVSRYGAITGNYVLQCLVNPMHVVAVPQYNTSKMRVCEYYPFAISKLIDVNTFETIEQPFFEDDYIEYEKNVLNDMIQKVKQEEGVFESAINVVNDEIDFEEYEKILSSRVTVLS